MAETIYTFVDFETTGLDPKKDQVIEIYAYQTDLKNKVAEFHTFVKLHAVKALPAFIHELTGIHESDLKNGIQEEKALLFLASFIGETTLVAHNATFEMAFLKRINYEPMRFICTRAICLLENPNESSRLEHQCQKWNIQRNKAHRSKDDTLATYRLFNILKPILDKKKIEYLNTLVVTEDRPLMHAPSYAKIIQIERNDQHEKNTN